MRILEGEVERCRAEVEGVRRVGERVRGVLGEIEGLGKEVEGGNAEKVESEEMVDEKGRWEEIFREFGQPGEMAGAS